MSLDFKMTINGIPSNGKIAIGQKLISVQYKAHYTDGKPTHIIKARVELIIHPVTSGNGVIFSKEFNNPGLLRCFSLRDVDIFTDGNLSSRGYAIRNDNTGWVQVKVALYCENRETVVHHKKIYTCYDASDSRFIPTWTKSTQAQYRTTGVTSSAYYSGSLCRLYATMTGITRTAGCPITSASVYVKQYQNMSGWKKTVSGGSDFNHLFPYFTQQGTFTVVWSCTNARGTYTQEQTITVKQYNAPSITTALKAWRTDSSKNPTDTGTYGCYTWAASYANGVPGNSINAKLYAKNSTRDLGAVTYQTNELLKNSDGTVISNFDAETAYTVRLTLEDAYGGNTVTTVKLPARTAIINIKSDGSGLGFFCDPETGEVKFDAGKTLKHGNNTISESGHTHTKSQISDFPTLGTAASKNTGTDNGNVPLWANSSNGNAQIVISDTDGTLKRRAGGTGSLTRGIFIDNNGSIAACRELSTNILVASVTSSSKDVNAGSTQSFTNSVTKSNYTPIGIVGYTFAASSGAVSNIVPYRVALNGTAMAVNVRNTGTANITGCTVTVGVLYIRNDGQ